MMRDWRLYLILIFASLLRFWQLGVVPPMAQSSSFSLRILSALFSLGSIIFLYLICQKIFVKRKSALLSSFIFAILPWTIEQGRIASGPNNALFWVLFITFVMITSNSKVVKLVSAAVLPILLYFSYPTFWVFRKFLNFSPNSSLLNNIFALISPEFLFFKNDTFWWGGVRDFGAINLSLLPVFLIGIFHLPHLIRGKLLFLSFLILLVAATSPFFPESREFYMITPIIAIIIALGIYRLYQPLTALQLPPPSRSPFGHLEGVFGVVIFVFLLLFIYDFSSFLHFYVVHYPQQVASNLSQIHEAF